MSLIEADRFIPAIIVRCFPWSVRCSRMMFDLAKEIH